MAVFYDTNILLELARDFSKNERVRLLVNPSLEPEYTSVVCRAELLSLAVQNGWNPKKTAQVDRLFSYINVLTVDNQLVSRYVEIDFFSQKQIKQHTTEKQSARNMGKNDIWIAATASLLNARLLTADKDFDHLKGNYLQLTRFEPDVFRLPK